MTVEFYFDPSCPFCWITSRWLLMVSGKRKVNIVWRAFSLAIKNNELVGGHDKTEHGDLHRSSHRILRVMQEATKNHGTELIDLYTDFGIAHHIAGEAFDDELIRKILTKNKFPSSLLRSADDTKLDSALEASVESAVAVAGKDIGVPTIVFVGDDGQKNGFFGPVLQTLPDLDEALKLWDGLSMLASDANFYELKRTRPSGDPDVFSTAKC